MQFCCLSDLHGNLPTLPECDVVLIAGDICTHGPRKFQLHWMDTQLRQWLESLHKPVFACAGNHDWPMYENLSQIKGMRLPWTYLQDESVVYEGFKIYGSPHSKIFYDWAFNLTEAKLMGKWNLIPDDTNILITHSPPKYYGDKNPDGEFCGSESLAWRIGQLSELRLAVFGHIHHAMGEYKSGDTILVNASLTNERYEPVNPIRVIELFK